jgi:hypothetical protein
MRALQTSIILTAALCGWLIGQAGGSSSEPARRLPSPYYSACLWTLPNAPCIVFRLTPEPEVAAMCDSDPDWPGRPGGAMMKQRYRAALEDFRP